MILLIFQILPTLVRVPGGHDCGLHLHHGDGQKTGEYYYDKEPKEVFFYFTCSKKKHCEQALKYLNTEGWIYIKSLGSRTGGSG